MGEIEYVLYVTLQNRTLFCGKTGKLSVVSIPLLTIFMYLTSVVVGFGCIAVVRPFEITVIIWRSDTER